MQISKGKAQDYSSKLKVGERQFPIVCLITGPAGSGKSSVAERLATEILKSAYINVDSLHNLIVNGRVRPWPWNDEVKLQTTLGATNACSLAVNFLNRGFNVFIDAVVGEKLYGTYQELLRDYRFKVFLLLPSKEILLKRFDDREKDDDLRERTKELHDKFTILKDEFDWVVIDSTGQTLEETCELLKNKLPLND